ncbi:BrxA family protein [Acinetobacter johnsonii]|uniref:BrxA family protein n=1 Tax=Acinetobacter johnsonii TaxID=40214 RepID=UPI003AF413F5
MIECFDEYNTAIKDIAGIKDYTLIFNIINAYFNEPSSISSRVSEGNEFDIRTLKTRTKVSWAINKAILQFVSEEHRNLISKIFQENIPLQDKKFAFFWHFCLTNRLFREITIKVFTKVYFSGRAQISKEDIIGYIKDISDKDHTLGLGWSEETIYRLATKYLSLMTKFDFVSAGRIKSFNYIRPSSEALILFLYFAHLYSPNMKNILENELLPATFLAGENIQVKLKKLSIKGFFNMNFNGLALNIELKYSHKEICDALYS